MKIFARQSSFDLLVLPVGSTLKRDATASCRLRLVEWRVVSYVGGRIGDSILNGESTVSSGLILHSMLLADVVDVDELAVHLPVAVRLLTTRVTLRLEAKSVARIVVGIGERIGWRSGRSTLGLRQALLPMNVGTARPKAGNE